jgi:hypothetical protein
MTIGIGQAPQDVHSACAFHDDGTARSEPKTGEQNSLAISEQLIVTQQFLRTRSPLDFAGIERTFPEPVRLRASRFGGTDFADIASSLMPGLAGGSLAYQR